MTLVRQRDEEEEASYEIGSDDASLSPTCLKTARSLRQVSSC